MYFSGLRLMRVAPNQESWKGPEFLIPSMISHGDISLISCTLRPWRGRERKEKGRGREGEREEGERGREREKEREKERERERERERS